MPKVSIIIPFNNVEQYIGECLDSVVNQTLEDIEIILVNDACEDNSRNIAEDYKNKDSRIKIIDLKEKHGQGFARNRALEIAQGEYIGFVDADDKVEPYMFSELYKKAKENDDEIVLCQAREFDDTKQKFLLTNYYSLVELEKMSDKVFCAEDVKDVLLNINVVLWNKIYKREYLEKIGEKLPEGFIYEDLPFFFASFLPAKRIQIVWKSLYIYRINRKNSTMRQFNEKIIDRIYMVSLTYDILKKFDFLSDISMRIKGWIINDLFTKYGLLESKFQKEYFFLMKKIFENLDIRNPEDEFWRDIYYFKGYLLVINNSFEEFNQKIFSLYTNIYEVESRIYSKVYEKTQADEKLSQVYAEIGRVNYNLEDMLRKKTDKISQDIYSELIEKFQTSINKTDKNLEEINLNIQNAKNEMYGYFGQNFEDAKNNVTDLDAKISDDIKSLYGDISFDIEKNNEILRSELDSAKKNFDNDKQMITENINNKYSDLSERLNNIYTTVREKADSLLTQLNRETGELYKKSGDDYNSIINITQANTEMLKQLINSENERNVQNLQCEINNEKTNIENKINDVEKQLNKKFDENLSETQIKIQNTIQELQDDFEKRLNIQKNEYEDKIKILTERIEYLSKSPIKRYMDKIKKNNA